MNHLLKMLFASLALALSLNAAHAEEPLPADSTIQQWMAELMTNVDLQLFMRIQQTVMDNMELVGPYSQEYYTCLRDEGALDSEGTPSLEQLIEQAKVKGKNCHFILQALIEQMNFDITEEEFQQGLSPKYRDLLKQG